MVQPSRLHYPAAMSIAYFCSDETFVRAPARRCYELVLAVRRYPQWWPSRRCEPLGPEGILCVGSRFRVAEGSMRWVAEITALQPWRQIDLEYAEGDLLGPVRWELFQENGRTRVRRLYRGVRVADGRATEGLGATLRVEAFPGMRRLLEGGADAGGGDLFESMYSLVSVRRFRSDPVPDACLRQILEAATHAPSARNAQPWYFVAVRDAEKRRAIAALYLQAWRQARSYTAAANADADIEGRPGYGRMMQAVDELAEHVGAAPVLILACLDTAQLGPMADAAGHILSPLSAYASIFPAVQNLMLAARALGLGTTLTTVTQIVEPEIRELAGIPARVHIAALLPLGYPRRPFRVTRRKPVSGIAFLDHWGTALSAT